MKRQRNTAQMKEQIRSTEVQIHEEEKGKLPEKVFRSSAHFLIGLFYLT